MKNTNKKKYTEDDFRKIAEKAKVYIWCFYNGVPMLPSEGCAGGIQWMPHVDISDAIDLASRLKMKIKFGKKHVHVWHKNGKVTVCDDGITHMVCDAVMKAAMECK